MSIRTITRFITVLKKWEKFRLLIKISETVRQLIPRSLKYRREALEDDEIDPPLARFDETLQKLLLLRETLISYFSLENIPLRQELEEHLGLVEKSSIFSWLNSDWRRARNSVLSLAIRPGIKIQTLRKKFKDLSEYRTFLDELENNQKVKDALGEHYKGLDTCSREILELRKWYKEVQNAFGVGFAPDAKIGEELIALDISVLKGLHRYEKTGLSANLKEILEDIDRLRSFFPSVQLLNDDHHQFLQEDNVLTQLETYINAYLPILLKHCKSKSKSI